MGDSLAEGIDVSQRLQWAEGSELRALRSFLEAEDPGRIYGGLKKVPTPEGHYLWLCDYHAQQYKV
jgi:hypothetical protein